MLEPWCHHVYSLWLCACCTFPALLGRTLQEALQSMRLQALISSNFRFKMDASDKVGFLTSLAPVLGLHEVAGDKGR